MMDAWEGHQGTLEQAQLEKSKKKLPDSLTVTIYAKHCENMKCAQLDLNETSLVFSVEGLYYLDLNLKYQVNSSESNAKFDKSKKTLTIRMPVTGLTADSKRVAEQHYQEYLEAERKRQEEFNALELSTLQEDADRARINKYKPGGDQDNDQDEAQEDDQENAGDILNAAAAKVANQAEDGADGVINEGIEGVSSKKFLMESNDSSDKLNNSAYDKYSSNSQIPPSAEDD